MSDGVYSKLTGYHNRRSIRLPGYDYSQPGYYFVTVCIHDRTQRLFGDIPVGAGSKPALVHKTKHGCAGSKPAHVHDEIEHRAGLEPAPTVALPEIIRQLKTFTAKKINKSRNTIGQLVWQRNYYEHIIRDETSSFFIRKYIRENPLNRAAASENHIDREIPEFDVAKRGYPK